MYSEEKLKLLSLIQSGITENITLAFELAQAVNTNLVFPEYIELYYCLEKHAKIKPAQRFETMLKRIISLNSLDFSSNSIQQLPNIELATNIKKLTLGLNHLEQILEKIDSFQKLEVLISENSEVKEIPCKLSSISTLKYLKLNNNKITTIPQNIGEMINLESIFLNNNQINEIPENICLLKKLRWLCLSENNLSSLPENIGNLQNLTFLFLRDNKIKLFPESIFSLTNLKILNISGNPISRKQIKETKVRLPNCIVENF